MYKPHLVIIFLLIFLLPFVTLFGNETAATPATSPQVQLQSTKQTLSSASDPLDPVQVFLFSENSSIQPGNPFWVIIRLQAQKGWHSYWKNPGEAGMPTQVEWELPAGFQADEVQWPYPQKIEEGGIVSYGYSDTVDLLVRITPSASLSGTNNATLKAMVNWMVCHESCVPGSSSIELVLPVKEAAPVASSANLTLFATARKHIPQEKKNVLVHQDGNNLITLLLPDLKGAPLYQEGYFFPELPLPEGVKWQEKLVEEKGRYSLRLSFDTPEGWPLSTLDGVIVLKAKEMDDSTTAAWHIHEPLKTASLTETSSMGFGLALLLALIGGLILNLMPCVLPVIALKVMSFVKLSAENRLNTLKHGLAFFGGALVAFWVLATVLLVFRSYGQALGWGFQLQSPLFVAFLGVVLWIFGLSLFGVFEMGTSISSLAGQAQGRTSGLIGSFCNGVLATAVATPCTGPFLGATVGFAITLPNAAAMLIFTAMGVGMGLPYLLLAFFPSLLRFMPKPGAWMVAFKELMGFLMAATVLWLIWVFAAQTTVTALMVLLGSLFSISLGCWIYGKWGSPAKKEPIRWTGRLISAFLLAGSLWAIFVVSSFEEENSGNLTLSKGEVTETWIPFSPEKLAELREKNIPVFIDFTAKWCLICQANKIVLHSREVMSKFAERGVVTMSADWTKNDAVITEELHKFGRNGVPLYLLYDNNTDEPQIFPQLLTTNAMIKAIEELAPSINSIEERTKQASIP